MGSKKIDVAIVSRGFWPEGQVIGEGLLQLAEQLAKTHEVCVITQQKGDLAKLLMQEERGADVQVKACTAYTGSASPLVKRIAEAVLFMWWTFICLVRTKPESVYVSTNPPVIVPFIVAIYCRLFSAKYYYHLQDIHPEAANIVVPLNGVVFRLLRAMDNFTLRNAAAVITLSKGMKAYIEKRSNTTSPIFLLDNPSFDVQPIPWEQRTKDVVFCGNAGRFQRIPLLLAGIRAYIEAGGILQFTFAGGGVYAADIKALADAYQQVDYHGVLPPAHASTLISQHRWALLPIDDEVTVYAFPSKSSGYALAETGIVAVCGAHTSVAKWVEELDLGCVCLPELDALVECFFSLEASEGRSFTINEETRRRLQIPYFAKQLRALICD